MISPTLIQYIMVHSSFPIFLCFKIISNSEKLTWLPLFLIHLLNYLFDETSFTITLAISSAWNLASPSPLPHFLGNQTHWSLPIHGSPRSHWPYFCVVPQQWHMPLCGFSISPKYPHSQPLCWLICIWRKKKREKKT